ncbi:MAG TPA: hypothetical protein VFB16_15765 [Bauldia sp.]|nr:hypothetical protein [Bauldia sp.]
MKPQNEKPAGLPERNSPHDADQEAQDFDRGKGQSKGHEMDRDRKTDKERTGRSGAHAARDK